MSTGIADAGMQRLMADKPTPLPVQALDHATGYLMAAAAIRGIVGRLRHGAGLEARFSLARIAKVLADQGSKHEETPLLPETPADRSATIETTDWGEAQRIAAPVRVSGAPMWWSRPARRLGTDAPRWLDASASGREPV
jgi:formyl-CoA transferase